MMAVPIPERPRLKPFARNLFAALPFAVVIALVGVLTNFHTPLNDFWGNQHLAQRLDARDPGTFYDGFFPIGYTLLLRVLSHFGYPACSALGINVVLTWFLAFSLLGVLRLHGLEILPSLIVAGLVLLFPQVFQCLYTPGADSGAMVFFTIGSYALLVALLAPTPRSSGRHIPPGHRSPCLPQAAFGGHARAGIGRSCLRLPNCCEFAIGTLAV